MRAAIAAVALVAAVSAGCSDDGAEMAELDITATETTSSGHGTYRFEMPEQVAAGATRISLRNEGAETHHAQLFRLDGGATTEDLAAALASGGPAAAAELGTFVGGTGLVDPGEASRADAVVDLSPGRYAFICFVEGADGTPHLAHGMLRPFEVTAAAEPGSVDGADARITLVDYAFDAPAELDGDALVEIVNTATHETHEMAVGRLDEGATAHDVAAAVHEGRPPPATFVGGVQALPPGSAQHLQLDLEPGRYVLICHVPSADGAPHHTKGMVAEIAVT